MPTHASAETAPERADARINVLMLIAGLGLGGAETVVRLLAAAIDAQRFNVTLACVKGLGPVGRDLVAAGADIVCLSDESKKGTDYLRSLTLRQVVRERRIDIVHSHTTDALVDTGLCKLLMPRLRTLHTFHFGNYPHLPGRHLWLERTFSRFATRLIAVGETQRRQIQAVYGFPDDRIGMIWNGVPEPPQARDHSFRDRIGAGDRVIIGTVATLIEQKGLRDLILVAERLKDLRSRAMFVIVGDGRLRGELEAMRKERGLEDMVALAGWVPSAAEVAVPVFDVFFQPSLWEAMSVAILEAMAAGKPVVATRVGENPRVIADGVDGLLVDAKDVDGMAATLRRVIDDAELRRRLGSAAAAKVANQFTMTHMSRSYEKVYVELLEGRR